MKKEYDIVILGGGPGGYVAAIKAAQAGLRVAIVEKEKLGGTCLHQGCIPTKTLLRSAEVYRNLQNSSEFGLYAENISFNFIKIQERKEKIVANLYKGIQYLMKKNAIDIFSARGTIMGASIFSPLAGSIAVDMKDADNEDIILTSKNLIIATGSIPKGLGVIPVDGKHIINSDHALQFTELPQSIIIIGGGVIGVEWASLLCDFGVAVTILEYADHIIPLEDIDISRELTKQLTKKGIKIVTNVQVIDTSVQLKDTSVHILARKEDEEQRYSAQCIMLATGRIANTENIGLHNTNIVIKNNCIETNNYMQTAESHIYAIGDVCGRMPLAHVASAEAEHAIMHILGNNIEPLNYEHIPRCMYTSPEIATVGLSEKQAHQQGYVVKVGHFNFAAIGKALVYGESDGFVKVITDAHTHDILGVHIIGPHATDMISEASFAKIMDATAWEVGSLIHPHPTLSEALMEAFLDVNDEAIHK